VRHSYYSWGRKVEGIRDSKGGHTLGEHEEGDTMIEHAKVAGELRKMEMDMINRPPHYNMGKIEVIDFIEDQNIGYHLSHVIKYVCRAAHKGQEIGDLKKAAWYLERYIWLKEKKNG